QEVDVHWSDRSQWRDLAGELAGQLGMSVFFGPIYSLDPPEPGQARREYGNALLSRFPIQAAENHEITRLSSQVPDPRPEPMPGFPEIEINVDGTPVHLYGTHLDVQPEPDVREMQVSDMRRIMNRDRGEARILLGDFNAEPGAPELRPLWRELTDVWGQAGGNAPGATYPAQSPEKRIDFIGVSHGIKVKGVDVPETVASDHRPVVTDLKLRGH
ncbi:MAG: endonuclease/exonuclease/phosphatase family protein, partial [Stackebrandtia sp.]